MTDGYFILENGEQTGPFTFGELTDMGLDLHTRVLSPNADTWQDACDLPEFYEYFLAEGYHFPTEDNLASFWWRLLAFILDYVIVSVVFGLAFTILASRGALPRMQSIDDFLKLSSSQLLTMRIVIFGTLIIYNAIGEASGMKGSLGKKICGIVVVNTDGEGLSFGIALVRSIGKVVSIFVIWGLGTLSIFFTDNRQSLHDLVARTYVVKL
jgi:uncharacterized RDD family membrane protein YckC